MPEPKREPFAVDEELVYLSSIFSALCKVKPTPQPSPVGEGGPFTVDEELVKLFCIFFIMYKARLTPHPSFAPQNPPSPTGEG